jgi:hypothetical protein
LIVALSATLGVCGSWFTSNGSIIRRELISPYYSPDIGVAASGFNSNAHTHFLIWFVFIAIWTVISMFLLRGKSEHVSNRLDDGTESNDEQH